MIKTNPKSWFAHKSLNQIQHFDGVVLQAEKTESTYTESKEAVYLCELVERRNHPTRTIENLSEEILQQNNEIRKLHKKIEKLQKELQKLSTANNLIYKEV